MRNKILMFLAVFGLVLSSVSAAFAESAMGNLITATLQHFDTDKVRPFRQTLTKALKLAVYYMDLNCNFMKFIDFMKRCFPDRTTTKDTERGIAVIYNGTYADICFMEIVPNHIAVGIKPKTAYIEQFKTIFEYWKKLIQGEYQYEWVYRKGYFESLDGYHDKIMFGLDKPIPIIVLLLPTQ